MHTQLAVYGTLYDCFTYWPSVAIVENGRSLLDIVDLTPLPSRLALALALSLNQVHLRGCETTRNSAIMIVVMIVVVAVILMHKSCYYGYCGGSSDINA